MSHHPEDTTARDGLITFVLSLALWGSLMAVFLGVGHLLAVSVMASHH